MTFGSLFFFSFFFSFPHKKDLSELYVFMSNKTQLQVLGSDILASLTGPAWF